MKFIRFGDTIINPLAIKYFQPVNIDEKGKFWHEPVGFTVHFIDGTNITWRAGGKWIWDAWLNWAMHCNEVHEFEPDFGDQSDFSDLNPPPTERQGRRKPRSR